MYSNILLMNINAKSKGWLTDTVAFRKANLSELVHENQRASNPLLSIYQAIQPVGLINGQLFGQMIYPGSEDWGSQEKTKVLFADCLISSSLLLFDNQKIKDQFIVDQIISKAVANISKFYSSIYPELNISKRNFFGQKKDSYELAELILEKRVKIVVDTKHKFIEQFFHNGLLFLDIYTFSRWINTQGDEVSSGLFKTLLEELRFSVVKIIASAAHSNKSIEKEEKEFLDYFLNSSSLPSNKIGLARTIFEKGIAIRELDLHPDYSWVVKKYFLEMAIVTIWADKVIDKEEMSFLEKFCSYLELNQADLKNSLLSIKQMAPNQNFEWEEIGK